MRRRFCRRSDEGAAAVEFALLVPIFVMLAFGTLTGGLGLYQHISDVQAARDAARYGSTLPISAISPTPAGALSPTDWVNNVRDTAMNQIWGLTGPQATLPSSGYLCVAFVQGTDAAQSGTVTTTSTYAGTGHNGYTAPAATAPCIAATSEASTSYDRVQVVAIRDATFNAVLVSRTWAMTTATVIRYERAAK